MSELGEAANDHAATHRHCEPTFAPAQSSILHSVNVAIALSQALASAEAGHACLIRKSVGSFEFILRSDDFSREALSERWSELAMRLATTPAKTMEGLIAKIALIASGYAEDDLDGTYDGILASAALDAQALANARETRSWPPPREGKRRA